MNLGILKTPEECSRFDDYLRYSGVLSQATRSAAAVKVRRASSLISEFKLLTADPEKITSEVFGVRKDHIHRSYYNSFVFAIGQYQSFIREGKDEA